MKQKTHSEKLDEAIALLQLKQSTELALLKSQFHETYESLNPLNIVKSTFKDLIQSPDIKNNIVNNLIGVTTGYISKKVIIGSTNNPIKNIFGTLLQIAVSGIVAKNADQIKTGSGNLLHRFLDYKKSLKQAPVESENL